eukprot:679760-Rhodomonas_salina.1
MDQNREGREAVYVRKHLPLAASLQCGSRVLCKQTYFRGSNQDQSKCPDSQERHPSQTAGASLANGIPQPRIAVAEIEGRSMVVVAMKGDREHEPLARRARG